MTSALGNGIKRHNIWFKPDERTFKEDIGETFSLIYSPFLHQTATSYRWGYQSDVAPGKRDRPPYISDLDQVRPGVETHFIAGICPGCGADLEGSGDSLALVCRNCHSLWRAKGKTLAKIKFSTAAPAHKEDIMLPFWRISAKVSPMTSDSHADLGQDKPAAGNSPELGGKACAFRVRHLRSVPNILRLLGQITSAQLEPALSQND